jgi:hypothetical protein
VGGVGGTTHLRLGLGLVLVLALALALVVALTEGVRLRLTLTEGVTLRVTLALVEMDGVRDTLGDEEAVAAVTSTFRGPFAPR